MVKESITHSQLNTCSSAERMPDEYAQCSIWLLFSFFPSEASAEGIHSESVNGVKVVLNIFDL